MAESVGDFLSRACPDIEKQFRDVIEVILAKVGVVDGKSFPSRDRVSAYLGIYLTNLLVENGMLLNDEEKQQIEKGTRVMANLSMESYNFDEMRIFYCVPVPWLFYDDITDPNYRGRIRLDAEYDGKVWLYGRKEFSSVHREFVESESGCMQLDGIRGVGKSYLLLMVANRCFADFAGTNNRLVCLFPTIIEATSSFIMLAELKSSLLLTFANDKQIQRRIAVAESDEELLSLVREAKNKYTLYFITDSFYEFCSEKLSCCTFMEKNCRHLRACTSQASKNYDRLDEEELKVYLDKEGVDKHSLLENYTGLLPKYVSVFVKCQKTAQSDEELIAAYEKSFEVKSLHDTLTLSMSGTRRKRTAPAISHKRLVVELYTELLCNGTAPTDFADGQFRHWIPQAVCYLRLFPVYARSIFTRNLEILEPRH